MWNLTHMPSNNSDSMKIANYMFNDYIDLNFKQMNPILDKYYNAYKKQEVNMLLRKKSNLESEVRKEY